MNLAIKVTWDDDADQSLGLPRYETAGAAGADVRANFGAGGGERVLEPGARALIPTGIRMAVPTGYEVQVRPRSGLALKHGISLVNTPGTFDSDYRGPMGIILINLGQEPFAVTHGMRIAQLIAAPVVLARFELVQELDDTERGDGGFGSTGFVT